MRLNQNDTRTASHLRERAQRLREEAHGESRSERRLSKLEQAADLDCQARDAERLRG